MLNCLKIDLIICIKMDLALDNLQGLISHKTQPTNHLMLRLYGLLMWVFTSWEKSPQLFFSLCIDRVTLAALLAGAVEYGDCISAQG